MLAFMHDTAAPDCEGTRQSLEALGKQLQLANRAASRFRVSLPSRAEAISQLQRETSPIESEAKFYVGIFAADVLSTLRSRHGNEVSEYLLDEVSRRNILPLVPGGKIFRWSAQSILAIWRSPNTTAQISAYIANSCAMPFSCQVFVGTRTATFQITMRSAVWQTHENTAELICALDSFSMGAVLKS
jgi:hypothetical protein